MRNDKPRSEMTRICDIGDLMEEYGYHKFQAGYYAAALKTPFPSEQHQMEREDHEEQAHEIWKQVQKIVGTELDNAIKQSGAMSLNMLKLAMGMGQGNPRMKDPFDAEGGK